MPVYRCDFLIQMGIERPKHKTRLKKEEPPETNTNSNIGEVKFQHGTLSNRQNSVIQNII